MNDMNEDVIYAQKCKKESLEWNWFLDSKGNTSNNTVISENSE